MNPVKFVKSLIRGLCFPAILLLTSLPTFAQPTNDACGVATLVSGTACVTTPGSFRNGAATATATPGISAFCGGATTSADVWYSFVAQTTNPTIRLSNMGSSLRSSNTRLQLFNTNSCTAATLNANSNNCASGTTINSMTLSPATALTIGNTYQIRVFITGASAAAGMANTWGFEICVQDAVPANNLCGSPTVLTSSTSCVSTTGSMYGSTITGTTISAPNCGLGATYDVWYRFVANTTNPTITLSNIGGGFVNPQMQLLSNNCGSTYTSYFCGTTSISANYLTPGTIYLIRVFSTSATAPVSTAGSNTNFDICVVDPVTTVPPANDNCPNAVNLSVNSNCASVNGDMSIATPSPEPLGGTCLGLNGYDVWYKFKAITANETVTLGSIGANFLNPRIEILSGSCGSFTSVLCGASPLVATTLTPGATYYVRVYSQTPPAPNGNARFSICVTTPDLPTVRYGNSYVNISQKTTGGVVRVGDTLEIRMTIHHSLATTLTRLRFVDSVPTNTTMLTGPTDRLKVITNEGLTYKAYTFAGGDDAGTYLANPPAGQYNIRMNLGFGASNPAAPVQ